MQLNRILVPIDFSQYSKAANFYASQFAEAMDAEIIFLHVADPPPKDRDVEDELDALILDFSYKVRPFVYGVRHCYEVRFGQPAAQILKLADERNVDLIVIGTHGRTGSSRVLHGSVCEKVFRRSTCPVLGVKSSININWVFPSEDQVGG